MRCQGGCACCGDSRQPRERGDVAMPCMGPVPHSPAVSTAGILCPVPAVPAASLPGCCVQQSLHTAGRVSWLPRIPGNHLLLRRPRSQQAVSNPHLSLKAAKSLDWADVARPASGSTALGLPCGPCWRHQRRLQPSRVATAAATSTAPSTAPAAALAVAQGSAGRVVTDR